MGIQNFQIPKTKVKIQGVRIVTRIKFNAELKGKGKGHPCTGTEALYRPYGP